MPEHAPDFIKFMNMPPFDAYFPPKNRRFISDLLHQYLKYLPMDKIESFMPFDLSETSENYVVEMPLPGFSPSQIHISLSGNNVIHIDADPPEASQPGPKLDAQNPTSHQPNGSGQHVQCKIIWSQIFWRRPIHVEIPIDSPVDPDLVKAKLEKGILTVTFQKIPPSANGE